MSKPLSCGHVGILPHYDVKLNELRVSFDGCTTPTRSQ